LQLDLRIFGIIYDWPNLTAQRQQSITIVHKSRGSMLK